MTTTSSRTVGAAFVHLAVILGPSLVLVGCEAASSGVDTLGSTSQAVTQNLCGDDDSLFVGDRGGHDSVERFDAITGEHFGAFVPHQSGGLRGPSALLFNKRGNDDAELYVVNQNTGTEVSGEVLRYDAATGDFLGALVPSSDQNAPFFPRGMVLDKQHTLFVADLGEADLEPPGRIARYDEKTGAFLGNLDLGTFSGQLLPRDIVVGPDGYLYASIIPPVSTQNGGYIVRFDPKSASPAEVVVDPAACNSCLNRPGGLAFGDDGRLYALHNRLNTGDNDRIEIFAIEDGHGTEVGRIDLDVAGQARAIGTALVFGPSGGLFVTITNTGEVRRYNVQSGTFTSFVPPAASGGPLLLPFYMTFRNTDPATFAYKPKGESCH